MTVLNFQGLNQLAPDKRYVALVLCASVLLYLAGRCVYLVYFHPLSNVPGPWQAKLTDWWQMYHAARLTKAAKIQEAHLKYGDVIRVGPSEVSVSNPGYMKAIYGHGVPVVKTEFYTGGTFTGNDNIFTMRIREQHAARRKLMSRNFAQGPLMELVPQFMKKAETLCRKLEEQGPGAVNVYPWLHRLGLEFIIMQTLGYDPKLTDNNEYHPHLRELEVFPENFAITAVFPFLKAHGVNVPIKSINRPFRIQAGWAKYCMAIVQEQRLKDSKDKSPWIRRMTESKDEYLGRPLEDIEVTEEIISTLFAGSGTTSSTIAFLIYAVCSDETVYNKLKTELRQSFPDWPGRSTDLPPIGELQKLPYLNAVINESLRRFPSIPGSMPRKVMVDNFKVGEITLPRNTVVSAQNYSVHMHEDYFPNADVFDPERFLIPDSKAKEGLNPFSEGPRGCVGRNLAVLELQIVTALFFRYFDAKVDSSMNPDDMIMKVIFSGSPIGEKVLLNLSKDLS